MREKRDEKSREFKKFHFNFLVHSPIGSPNIKEVVIKDGLGGENTYKVYGWRRESADMITLFVEWEDYKKIEEKKS